MKFLKVAVLFFGLAAAFAVRAQGGTYPVSGRVIDRLSRRPVAYAAVVLAGQEQKGASTDSLGRFRIERVKPGIWRLAVSSVGFMGRPLMSRYSSGRMSGPPRPLSKSSWRRMPRSWRP